MSGLGDERPDLAGVLLAGRRAALSSLYEIANNSGGRLTYTESPDQLPTTDSCSLRLNGVDVTAAIDSVVMETIVRLENPENPPPKAKRRWWRFW